MAFNNVLNWFKQPTADGDNEQVIGGTQTIQSNANSNFESGSTQNFESGSALKIASVDKTAKLANVGVGEVVTAINVITSTESGKTFFLNNAVGFASTLPAPILGFKCKFVLTASPTSGALTVGTNAAATIIEGLANVANTLILAANEKLITFTNAAAIIGDWVELESNGTSWFVIGQGSAATSIAFT